MKLHKIKPTGFTKDKECQKRKQENKKIEAITLSFGKTYNCLLYDPLKYIPDADFSFFLSNWFFSVHTKYDETEDKKGPRNIISVLNRFTHN